MIFTHALAAAYVSGGVGHLAMLRGALAQQECPLASGEGEWEGGLSPAVVLGVLTQIQSWRERHEQLFLFDR